MNKPIMNKFKNMIPSKFAIWGTNELSSLDVTAVPVEAENIINPQSNKN